MFKFILTACLAALPFAAVAEATTPDRSVTSLPLSTPTFTGYVTYATDWIGDSGNNPRCGFYTFTCDGGELQQLTNDDWDMKARNGGTQAQGRYYAFYTAESWIFPDPRLYIYDVETWKQIDVISYGRSEKYAPTDLTFDYTTGQLLATAYSAKNSSGDGHLYRIDTQNGSLTELCRTPGLMHCLAADAEGVLWTINEQGYLGTLTRDGQFTTVGHTGYIPQSDESANSITFDHRTHNLYWAASVHTAQAPEDCIRALMLIDTKTGKAEPISTFPNDEKVTALSISYPYSLSAPDDITDLNLTPIQPGSMTAEVTFTVPAVSYIGKPLTDTQLSLTLTIDGTEVGTSLTATPGSTFSYTHTFPAVGTHVVTARLTDSSQNQGQLATVSRYIGFDTPATPTDATITVDPDHHTAILRWTPPTEGIHQGDLDKANLRYLVTRYSPGEKEDVAVDLAEPVFVDDVQRPMAYTRYGIVAYDTQRESAPVYTTYLHVGAPAELPFINAINSWADFHRFITIDANQDGYDDWTTPSWYYDEAYGAAFCYCTRADNQDDYLVTPALKFEKGRIYQVIFQTYGYYGYPNTLEVLTGPRPDVESLTTRRALIEYRVPMPTTFPYETDDVHTASIVFTADEDTRYVAFRNINQHLPQYYYTDHMSIDNVYIRDYTDLIAEGIARPSEESSTSPAYDLQGRRLDSSTMRGLYVKSGKKILQRN